MAFLDDAACIFNKDAPATGAPPDLARGRKASRKMGVMQSLKIVGAIFTLSGMLGLATGMVCLAFGAAAAGLLAAGLAVTTAGFVAMQSGNAGAERVFRRDGEHMNAYLDGIYPVRVIKRGGQAKSLIQQFGAPPAPEPEVPVTTDSPVTAMKPLKFQPPKIKGAQP
jgi:hypothetical protein